MQDHAVPDHDSFFDASHAGMDAFAKLSTFGSVSAVSPRLSVAHDHAVPDHDSF